VRPARLDGLRRAPIGAGAPGPAASLPIRELDGQDLRPCPWEARRKALARLLRGVGDGIRLSEHMDGPDGPAMFREACAMGLEGIVSKRAMLPTARAAPRIGSRSRTRTHRPPCE
jgi:hypothetical protein